MNNKTVEIWAAVQRVGQGVWFTQSVIARRVGCQPKTAKKYLAEWAEAGKLVTCQTLYNGHIRQTLYQMPDEGGEWQQSKLFQVGE